jgi:hypothetical protein
MEYIELFRCSCGWVGIESELDQQNTHGILMDVCPKCDQNADNLASLGWLQSSESE